MNFSKHLSSFNEHERMRFVFGFGVPFEVLDKREESDQLHSFLSNLYEVISYRTSGCTVLRGDGIWRSDGNSEPPYKGDVQNERSYTILVTVSPKDMMQQRCEIVRHVAQLLQERFGAVYNLYPIPIQWVHMEVDVVKVSHFDITDF